MLRPMAKSSELKSPVEEAAKTTHDENHSVL